ncbi:LysR substrate-binding domain-containing protein [Nonomuraea sp. NPDC049141]|uniref:LysR family transcriptional regulator n=1 Tax=unclassified Nonomuraea TaxID=2593643 RepID=UPI0033C6C0D7
MDVDLRKMRYFVAVAERLHFSRAAEDLHIAQPVLSRQIRSLEHDLDAQLFVRDSHGVSLTEAGRQLLDDARNLLTAAEATRRRVRRAARGPRRLAVGFRTGIVVTSAVRAFTAEYPDVTVDVRHIEWDDQADVILDGTVDIAYIRPPIAQTGLKLSPLYTEARLATLRADHPLAGKESLAAADLAGETHIRYLDIGASGTPIRTVEEKFEHIAAGHGIMFLPASIAAYYTRPDIAYVPVTDIEPDQVNLAWDAARRSPLITAFSRAARANAHYPGRFTDT